MKGRSTPRDRRFLFLVTSMATGLVILALAGCFPMTTAHAGDLSREIGLNPSHGLANPQGDQPASTAFWQTWGDGRAEISGYRVTTNRYGTERQGNLALIYVTETMDSRTWIKDDSGTVPNQYRVPVLKLNQALKFQTGIYPYSVMTSISSPVNSTGRERFAPAKISLSAQEWCGHVYHQLHPKGDHFLSTLHSYFHAEGDSAEQITVAPFTLYEDALLIQLRELDSPFADGGDWQGSLVPSLWSVRKDHQLVQAMPATIARQTVSEQGIPLTRFTVKYAGKTRVIDVERAAPRRVIGWKTSDGETARLINTKRLPYWQLNRNGDERHLVQLGLAD